MEAIAVVATLFVVTLAVGYAVSRTELGLGVSLATIEVAKSAPQYWSRLAPYAPAETPTRGPLNWAADQLLPQAALVEVPRPGSTWEIWDSYGQ